jgi:hypothetical protein
LAKRFSRFCVDSATRVVPDAADKVLLELAMGIGIGLTRRMVDDSRSPHQKTPEEMVMEEHCFIGASGCVKSRPSTPTTFAPPRRSQRELDHTNNGVIGRPRE